MPPSPPAAQRPLALITGASGGIGEEFARRLARDGYDLVLVARSYGRLEEIAAELRQAHRVEVRVLAVDLAHPSGPQRVCDLLCEQASRVEVLINNAGVGIAGDFATLSEADLLLQMQLNMGAVVQLTRQLLPAMLARGAGRILNVGSTAAFQPGPGFAIYFATKAFVLSFSEALDWELRGRGVTVTCLCPGPVATGFAARATLQQSPMFRGGGMSVERCVDVGYRALRRGRRVVVPGVFNWLLSFGVRFAPRWLPMWISSRLVGRQAAAHAAK